jgi:transposase, IS5 family
MDERLRWSSEAGDPLERLAVVVDLDLFRPKLDAVLQRSPLS